MRESCFKSGSQEGEVGTLWERVCEVQLNLGRSWFDLLVLWSIYPLSDLLVSPLPKGPLWSGPGSRFGLAWGIGALQSLKPTWFVLMELAGVPRKLAWALPCSNEPASLTLVAPDSCIQVCELESLLGTWKLVWALGAGEEQVVG